MNCIFQKAHENVTGKYKFVFIEIEEDENIEEHIEWHHVDNEKKFWMVSFYGEL